MSDGIDGLWEEVIELRNDLEALRRERDAAREFALEEGGRATAAEDTARKLERERDEATKRAERAEEEDAWLAIHLDSAKGHIQALEAKLQRAREDLEDLRWRLKPMNGVRVVDLDLVAEKVRRMLADLHEGGASAKEYAEWEHARQPEQV